MIGKAIFSRFYWKRFDLSLTNSLHLFLITGWDNSDPPAWKGLIRGMMIRMLVEEDCESYDGVSTECPQAPPFKEN